MKAILRITLLVVTIVTVAVAAGNAQRVIKGTVYMDGEPAAGITVEVHKGGSMLTSFDGKYELEADAKSKWIKFTYIDDSKRLDIEGQSGDVFDFAFTGSIPTGDNTGASSASGEVNLQSADQLLAAKDKDFMSELSLYMEFYKQDNFNSAFPHWMVLYDRYPKSTLNIYIHGAKMYEYKIDNATTDEEKDKLIDEYMKLYDKRIEYFDQKGYVLGRKGTSWLNYKLNKPRNKDIEGEDLKNVHKVANGWLTESVNLQGSESESPVVLLYMQTTFALYKLGEISKETVVKNYETSMEICNGIIANNANAEEVSQVKETIIPAIETGFGRSGAADCEALVNIYAPQFEEKQNDVEFITEMLRRLRRANCDEVELYERATERQYELDPSAEAAFNMAHRYLKKDDPEKAKEYYQEAMDQETDQDLLASYYYEYSVFLFAKEGLYQEARSYAKKALGINPDFCEANILIGNIYVAASQKFSNDDFEKSAVFWLAVDYFNKAKRGEACSIEASEKASQYRRYFPKKEDAFMMSVQEGDSYKVGGWINETTKARF